MTAVRDPFEVLGLRSSATNEEIRRSWRAKAQQLHPDTGGSHAQMVELNNALAQALRLKKDVSPQLVGKIHRDMSVFVIHMSLPDAWSSLEIVAAHCGAVIHSEIPEVLEFTLHDSHINGALQCWCRCDLVPEAGAVTVNVVVGSAGTSPQGLLESVRDYLVDALNSLD